MAGNSREADMTTEQNDSGAEAAAPPVACSLTAADLAAQRSRWQRLAARAMTGRTDTDRGLRISFRAEPGAEQELRALASAENECCSWATWAVLTGDGALVLDVQAAGDGIAALHAMFSDPRPAPDAPC
jgi:hypothetical protein